MATTATPITTTPPRTPNHLLFPFHPFPSTPTLLKCFPSPSPTSYRIHRGKSWVPSASSFRNGNVPETECPVPLDQQPVNEYQSLANSALFSWAAGDLWSYSSHLMVMGVSFAVLVGFPVARFGIDPEREFIKCGIGALSGGLLLVTLAVLRMYLGWAYVGNRLLSATVEYEETGWYDGQIWVKTPEILARDRLLGSYSVKPVLSRVKVTLVGLAISLVASILLFINIESPKKEYISSESRSARAIAGVYNDAAARSFEPDAFCGEPDLS